VIAQSAHMPLPVAIAVLALAHLFDLLTFAVMVGLHGPAAEANPLVYRLFEQLGMPGLTAAKIAAVVLGASVFVALAPRWPRLASVVLFFGIAAGVIGGITNLATF
jgi:hypothetical protein